MNWDNILLPYKQAADELKAKFDNLSYQFLKTQHTSPIVEVDARVKAVPSILAKIQRKRVPVDEIEGLVQDLCGIRIICRFVDDIDFVVRHILGRNDMEIIDDRDYVSIMKPSGYRGRHLILKYPVVTALGNKTILIEIQIRTLAMNMWAVTEHSLRYKHNGMIPEEIQKRLVRTADAAYVLDHDTNIIREDILAAEKSIQTREEIIVYITNSIEDLDKVADPSEVELLYIRFVEILEVKNDKALAEFHDEITLIAQAYRIR